MRDTRVQKEDRSKDNRRNKDLHRLRHWDDTGTLDQTHESSRSEAVTGAKESGDGNPVNHGQEWTSGRKKEERYDGKVSTRGEVKGTDLSRMISK